MFSSPQGGIACFWDQGNVVRKNQKKASVASLCSRGLAVSWPTQRELRRTGVLVASRETLNTTATTRRKILARVSFLPKEFSEKRRKLEAEISIEGLPCRKRYRKMQRKQPTTSKGRERRFSGKSRGLKSGPKLRSNQRARL